MQSTNYLSVFQMRTRCTRHAHHITSTQQPVTYTLHINMWYRTCMHMHTAKSSHAHSTSQEVHARPHHTHTHTHAHTLTPHTHAYTQSDMGRTLCDLQDLVRKLDTDTTGLRTRITQLEATLRGREVDVARMQKQLDAGKARQLRTPMPPHTPTHTRAAANQGPPPCIPHCLPRTLCMPHFLPRTPCMPHCLPRTLCMPHCLPRTPCMPHHLPWFPCMPHWLPWTPCMPHRQLCFLHHLSNLVRTHAPIRCGSWRRAWRGHGLRR